MLKVLGDGRQSRLEAGALVGAGVEDHPVDAEVVGGLQITGQCALGSLAEGWIVAGEVDQVDGVKIKGRVAVLGRRLPESGDAILVEFGRTPEPWRSRVDLYGIRPHGFRALKGKVETTGRVDVSSKNRHSGESNSGPIWHAGRALSVFVMGDLDLAIRGRTYREPDGPHSMVVRGRDLDSALPHVVARND